MYTVNRLISFLMVPLLISGCIASKTGTITPSHKKIKAEGRVAIAKDGTAEVYWPGSGFTTTFKGTGISVDLKDERGYNYFNVIIDDSLTGCILISRKKTTYILAAGLRDTIHTVQLLKRADWFRGKTWIYEFNVPPGTTLLRTPPRTRMIEFFGNSITVGAAVEDTLKDRGDSTFTNNYRSYASITARHFNANYSCIASSGIGLMASAGNLIMPDIYNRLDPDDSLSSWKFQGQKPGIVVINLFQNDSWIVNSPDFVQFKRRFGTQAPTEEFIVNAYKKFVAIIRSNYPKASIICTLGSMDAVKPGSPWPGYITKAVAALADPEVHTFFFDFHQSNAHPKIRTQQKMAEALIHFISNNIKW